MGTDHVAGVQPEVSAPGPSDTRDRLTFIGTATSVIRLAGSRC